VTEDEERDSFAARAAAWVPPWMRESETPEPVDVAPEPEPVDVTPDPEPDVEAEPVDVVPESDVASEPVDVAPEPVDEASEAEPVDEAPELVDEVSEAEPVDVVPEPVDEASEAEPVDETPEPVDVVPDLVDVVAEPKAEPAPADVPVAPTDVPAALEAILMVVDEPVTEQLLAQVLEQPMERIGIELARLADQYAEQGRGFQLRRAAGGWRFYTHPDQAAYVERFVLDGQSIRLTQAALETLAVVAYKQPVTRSRMSAIRGVNCDGVVRTLVTRGLIEECGTEPETGAHLYRTTVLFLEKLGLDSVEQLPPLAPFLPDDVDAIVDAGR
jgi:segregation and condensation protein B